MHKHLDVEQLTTIALNFYLGKQVGEMVKFLKAKGLWDEAAPQMNLLHQLCKEAGSRAQLVIPNAGWFAATLCDARNLWGSEYEACWLETDNHHPDDWIGNYLREQLILALRE